MKKFLKNADDHLPSSKETRVDPGLQFFSIVTMLSSVFLNENLF